VKGGGAINLSKQAGEITGVLKSPRKQRGVPHTPSEQSQSDNQNCAA